MDLNIDMRTIFASLSEDKQREIARRLVNEQVKNPMMHTIVIVPKTDEDGNVDETAAPMASGVNMKEMVDKFGQDYAENFMMSILRSGGVSTKVMDRDSIESLMGRCADRTATPEDYAMANVMLEQMRQRFTRNDGTVLCTKILLDLLHYTKQKQHVEMFFSDIMQSVFLLMLGSMINTKGTPMARFKDAGPQNCIAMADKLGDDIEKALLDGIFKNGQPNNQFLAMGFYALAMRYASKDELNDKMMFADAKLLDALFGTENEFEDFSEDEENQEKSANTD